MFRNINVTRTQKTESDYLKKAEGLFQHYNAEYGYEWKDNPSLFIHWFTREAAIKNWSKATVKLYRAALIFVLSTQGFNDAVAKLKELDLKLFSAKGVFTSSKKQKSFPVKDVLKIESKINTEKKWDGLLIKWIRAAILTGLRPDEWHQAKLVITPDSKPPDNWGILEKNPLGKWLIVKNAKDTNGRANGSYRALDLSNLKEDELSHIQFVLASLKTKTEYDESYLGCRTRLSAITKEIWPRRKLRPSLYSARHQFRANASSSGQSLEEIAALMGHGTNETASTHYGYAKWGSGRQPIQPHQLNVETVRRVYVSPSDREDNTPSMR
jgi:hypothetical protein